MPSLWQDSDYYKWKKEKRKGKKIDDSEEQMKESQPKNNDVKYEGLNVVTHNNNNGPMTFCMSLHTIMCTLYL